MIVSFGQCPVCFKLFDEKEHLPYDVCKEGHHMCLSCIKNIKKTHKTCTLCKNPFEERQNKYALQLLRVIGHQQLTINQLLSSQKSQTPAGKLSNSQNDQLKDSTMERTAFFPNPTSFQESLNQPRVLKPQTQQKAKDDGKSSNYELSLMQQHFKKLIERGQRVKLKCDEAQANIQKLLMVQPPPPELALWQQKLAALHNEYQKVMVQQKQLAAQCEVKALQQMQYMAHQAPPQTQNLQASQNIQNQNLNGTQNLQGTQNLNMSFFKIGPVMKTGSEVAVSGETTKK